MEWNMHMTTAMLLAAVDVSQERMIIGDFVLINAFMTTSITS
jgi:ABC-type transport system involved in Fe-S cluster assembly fused permease/ATPase subunit